MEALIFQEPTDPAAEEAAMQSAFEAMTADPLDAKPASSASGADTADPGPSGTTTETDQGRTEGGEAPPEVKIAGFTEAELRDRLDKAAKYDDLVTRFGAVDENIRRLDGRYGELNSRLTEPGEKVKLTREQLKHVSETYSDELADALAADLSEVLQVPKGSGVSQEAIAPIVDERTKAIVDAALADYADAMNRRFMTHLHRGWEGKTTSKDWTDYLASLPEADRTAVAQTTDPFELSDALTKFDGWQAARAQANQQRLEEAIPATEGKNGGAPTATQITEEDAMLAGFKAVRGV
ncbi:MAG: hypothetical protein AB7N65_14215 [Vicinamibacterales bacterium]